ncbi:MAG TPA: hypothetical protein VFL43_14205 [Variovorax sp.]|nr:hypothetical protein [Variovorax sp.]
MPIDRRTFVIASSGAAGGGLLASLRAVAAVAQPGSALPAAASVPPLAADTDGPSFELRIVGWDRSDGAAWIAIDPQWRGAWH